MIIEFTIAGNQLDQFGNPIPYVRSTQSALWRQDARRYADWKEYVRSAFYQQAKICDIPVALLNNVKNIALGKSVQPFLLSRAKAQMDIKIYWRDNTHGDPDNIWKGIADALFLNDKNLDGSFESNFSENKKGSVEVKITIKDGSK